MTIVLWLQRGLQKPVQPFGLAPSPSRVLSLSHLPAISPLMWMVGCTKLKVMDSRVGAVEWRSVHTWFKMHFSNAFCLENVDARTERGIRFATTSCFMSRSLHLCGGWGRRAVVQKVSFPHLSLGTYVIQAQATLRAQISEVPVRGTGALLLYINCPEFCHFYLDGNQFKSHAALPAANFGPEAVTCHEFPVCSCLGVTRLKNRVVFLGGKDFCLVAQTSLTLLCVFFSSLWSQPRWKDLGCSCCRVPL